jgi:hypothetical protein
MPVGTEQLSSPLLIEKRAEIPISEVDGQFRLTAEPERKPLRNHIKEL